MKKQLFFYSTGRYLTGLLCLMTGISCVVEMGSLEPGVPVFLGAPRFWLILMMIGMCGVGAAFLLDRLTRSAGTALCILVSLILTLSTYRGFYSVATFIPTVLSIAFYLSFIGSGLMIASRGQWVWRGIKSNMGPSDDLFFAGRILMGIFFFSAGWLHFDNIHGDAMMLGSMPGAVFWVIFVGGCWFAVAISFWTNIMSRLAALLASVLILVISGMITLRGFGSGDDFGVLLQLAKNLGVIGGCFLVASRGYIGLHTRSWWYPPKSWGFNIGQTNPYSCTSKNGRL